MNSITRKDSIKDKSKVLSTLDVGLEKSNNIAPTINYEFTTLSPNYSKFDRNYKKVLDEFNSLGWGETPAYLEDNKKLRLKALQTQVDKMKEQAKTDLSTKLKDMNFSYFNNSKTLSSPAGAKSPNNLKNLSSVKNDSSKEKYKIDLVNKNSGTPLKENDLVSEKYKFKIKEIMKKTEEAAKKASLKVNEKITKENLMSEFKLFEKERQRNFSRSGKSADGVKNFLIPQQEKKVQWNDSFDNSPSSKRQNAKKEIFNLLVPNNDSPRKNCNFKKDSPKNLFLKMKSINTNDNQISKNKNNLSMNLIDSGKISYIKFTKIFKFFR